MLILPPSSGGLAVGKIIKAVRCGAVMMGWRGAGRHRGVKQHVQKPMAW